VTSGEDSGTDGALAQTLAKTRARQVFWLTYAGIAAFVVVQCLVNAVSRNTEFRWAHQHVDPREPYIWELTSAVMTLALIPAVAWLIRRFPPGPGRWLSFFAVHVPATVVYCLIHVGGFHLLRRAVYAAFGAHYDGKLELLYEYPKDLAAYALIAWLFWLGGLLARTWTRADEARAARRGPVFDIRDGATLVRAQVTDIVAANSAGNYVEFHLADGRKPLMRTTLSAVETQLAPHGFLRTHRSWLINPLRVRGLTAEGSGDFRVELDGGAQAPLSRRFPQALEALRSPEANA
jgi:hypothetical protein